MFIVASLPRDCHRLVTMSMEVPTLGDDYGKEQFTDFIELALEMGCHAFYREDK